MNKRCPVRFAADLSRHAPVGIALLIAVVMLLATLALGLLWCQPLPEDISIGEDASPVGTWVSADCWEHGYRPEDIFVEFSSSGLMTVKSLDFTALYRFDEDILYVYDLDSGQPSGDTPGQGFDCTITGDYMMLRGQIPGIPLHHGGTMLIRISDQTGLGEEQLGALY